MSGRALGCWPDGDQDGGGVGAGGALGALAPAPAAGGDEVGVVAEDDFAGGGVFGFVLAEAGEVSEPSAKRTVIGPVVARGRRRRRAGRSGC
ncbi:MAG: hypothetical protein U0232_20555 [Thermomicrobiales bacterium]